MTPQEIREKIAEYRSDLARAEGQVSTLQKEADSTMAKLRKLLGCKKGKEKAAILKLRKQITADEAELEELLGAVEALRADEEDE